MESRNAGAMRANARTVGSRVLVVIGMSALGATAAAAADIGVVPRKYVVVDDRVAGRSKVQFVSKDRFAGITKGGGTNVEDISAAFHVRYDDETGSYTIAAGESAGAEGWRVNKPKTAKFVNTQAPEGSTSVRTAVIRPGKLLKLVAKQLGDADPLDIVATGAPTGTVHTAFCVTNGGERYCHCSALIRCVFKEFAGGTGAKLVCKGGAADPGCAATKTPPNFTYRLTTRAEDGSCGDVRAGGAGGDVLKSLGCGNIEIGAGFSVIPPGPIPAGATNVFDAACVGDECTLVPVTAAETGSDADCTDAGCRFGAYLSIANGPLSWCVANAFALPGSGLLSPSTGEVSASIPLETVVTYTGNDNEPCPPCSGAPGPGICDASAANSGASCTGINAAGDNYECAPNGSTLPGFGVDLTPLQTTTVAVDDVSRIFCPGQLSPGCFAEPTCDYVELNGMPGGPITAGLGHDLRLASVFCIPNTGNILINGAANLPGPGAITLPMEGILIAK